MTAFINLVDRISPLSGAPTPFNFASSMNKSSAR